MNVSDWMNRAREFEAREQERSVNDERIAMVLENILYELRKANSVERTGAVSSVELKFLANSTPQPVIKVYAGSEPPVAEAIEAYARTMATAELAQKRGWKETLDRLKAVRGTSVSLEELAR